MENKNIITLYSGVFKIKINEEELKYKNFNVEELKDFFEESGYYAERYNYTNNKEDFETACNEFANEFVYNNLSIYNYEIMEEFNKLEHYEIDEIVEYSGWIEYNPKDGFVEFAKKVVYEYKANKLYEDISEIIEHIKFIEFDEDNKEIVKNDIIEYLKGNRDIHIEKLAESYKKNKSTYIVEYINEYICKNNYCFEDFTLEGWDIYKYYCVDFYRDKDIQEAIFNY